MKITPVFKVEQVNIFCIDKEEGDARSELLVW